MYIPSLSLCPRPLASLCNLVQHSTMWYRPWKFNPHLVANKITQQKWFQIVLGWMCGGALWLFLLHLFLVSLSLSLCAVCDVGFWNNKWLDVFRCHVKPGESHVLSEHTTTAGGGGLGILSLGLGCTQSVWRHQTPVKWALCQVSVTGEMGITFKMFFPPLPWLVPCPVK